MSGDSTQRSPLPSGPMTAVAGALATTTIDGIRFCDVGVASGQPNVLLLHGLGNSLDFWTAVAPLLGASGRTVAVDIPGFGESDRPPQGLTLESAAQAIASLLRSINAGPVAVVAHSMGAYVALQLARSEPELVAHLTLVDGTLWRANLVIRSPGRAVLKPYLSAMVAIQFAGALVPLSRLPSRVRRAITRSRLLRRLTFWPYLADPAAVDSTLLEHALAHNTGRSILTTLRMARQTSLKALTDGVGHRTTVIFGCRDRLISDADVVAFRRLLQVASVIELKDCGHWPMVEAPEVLVDAIRSILNSDQ